MRKGIRRLVSFIAASSIVFGFSYANLSLFKTSQAQAKELEKKRSVVENFSGSSAVKVTNTNSISVEEYLKQNVDTNYVSKVYSLAQENAIRVKQVMVDGSTYGGVNTADEYWAITDNYDNYIKMNETVQILYDPGAESNYMLALINPMSEDIARCSVEFTRSNMQGEIIDNCHYDSDTGIAYIRKDTIDEDSLASVQAEVFYLCENNTPVNKSAITIKATGFGEDKTVSGRVELDASKDSFRIELGDSLHGNWDRDYVTLKINDHVVGEDYFWCKDDDSIVVSYPASGVYSLEVSSSKPSLSRRLIDAANEFWSAPTVNADTFGDMNVASGAWSASGGVPSKGTILVVDGVKVSYGNYTANGKTYIPRSERYLTDGDLAKMASIITSGASADITAQYYSAGNFQVYKVVIPDKTIVKDGITYHIPASTYILHCSHSTANAIPGAANRDPGKVIINIMGTSNGFALIGMFTEFPGYTQEGVGYFKVQLDTDTTANVSVDVTKQFDGRNYSNAVFAVVPEAQDTGNYGVGAMNCVRTFVREVYSRAATPDYSKQVQWITSIYNCRGAKETTAGVVRALFVELFAGYMHSEVIEDGSTHYRFNSPEDANYVIKELLDSLHVAYGYDPFPVWVYTNVFPNNTELDVYEAIENVMYAPAFHAEGATDKLIKFYVDPDVQLMTTDGSGLSKLDLYLGNYNPAASSTITKTYHYREVYGGREGGKLDNEVYKLVVNFSNNGGNESCTYQEYTSSGELIYEGTGMNIHLTNFLGKSQGLFINAKDDRYEPASISLTKTGETHTSIRAEQRIVNGKTYVVSQPYKSDMPLSGATYSISSDNGVAHMTGSGDTLSYDKLTSKVGETTTYKIYESSAPAGYLVSPEYWLVDVTRTHTVENDTNVYRDSVVKMVYYADENSSGVNVPLSDSLVAHDKLAPMEIKVTKTYEQAINSDINYADELGKCVFGLYSSEKITLGNSSIDAGTLVAVSGVNEISSDGMTGYARFTDVPNGKYFVKELQGSDHFVLDQNTPTVEVNRGKTLSYNVAFTNKTGTIDVTKTTPLDDKFQVETVTFNLIKDGKTISTGTTDSKGKVTWDKDVTKLALGDYTLVETFTVSQGKYYEGVLFDYRVTNNSGWVMVDAHTYKMDFSLSDDDTHRDMAFVVENDLQATEVKFLKRTLSEGDKSAIKFEIVRDDYVVASGNCETSGKAMEDNIIKWKFNGETELESIVLPVGIYELREYIPKSSMSHIRYSYMCPDGFKLSDNGEYFYKELYVTNSETQVVETVSNNRCEGDLSIRKTSEDGRIDNVGFRVFYLGDGNTPCGNEDRIRLMTDDGESVFYTDESGLASLQHLPYGWYEIEEFTPSGTKIVWQGETAANGNKLVHLSSDGSTASVYVDARNVINVSLNLTKVDLWSMKTVGGAAFVLFKDINENGSLDEDERSTGVVIRDEDKDGVIVFDNLSSGKYILKEFATVKDYYLNPKEIYIIVDDSKDVDVQVEEEPYAVRIKINKLDADDHSRLLDGAEFVLYQDKDCNGVFDADIDEVAQTYEAAAEVMKDAKVYRDDTFGDVVYFSDPVKPGHYLIEEITAPSGYEPLHSKFTPVVIDSANTDAVDFEYMNKEVSIFNVCRGSIHITKVDMKYSDRKLSGALFSVYADSNGNSRFDDEDELYGVLSEEEPGEYYIHEVPRGEYYVRETLSPEGYEMRKDIWPVTIEQNGRVYDIKDTDFPGIANKFSGSVTINKVDCDDYTKPVTGAVFGLYSDGVLISRITDNGDGIYTYKGLEQGEYYIKELEAPVGYIIDENSYYFNVSEWNPDWVIDNRNHGKDSYICDDYGLFVEYKPVIQTELTNNKDRSHEVEAKAVVQLTDKVAYKGLAAGEEYEVTGTLINRNTGKPVNGVEPVKVTFTTTADTGYVDVPFELDTGKVDGLDIVAFETITYKGQVIAEHADVNNKDQTVTIKSKKIVSTGEKTVVYYSLMGLLSVLGSAVLINRAYRKKDS
ncbi:MAG: VaFE repeat-containing surface-anchored protein [Saccharofermentans sp.]|nr:VaFE repeat-containing surface-anchored protein [Saccharofermentans sp.]